MSRRARRTLSLAVPTTAVAATLGGLALSGVFGPHHNTSSPAPLVTASTTVTPSPSEAPLPTQPATASPAIQEAAPTQPLRPSSEAAPADLDVHAVNWNEVALPGETCFSATSIQLHNGQAILPGTPFDRQVLLDQVYDPAATAYGRLGDSSTDDAAVPVYCAYAHGTAASTLRNAVVVFSGAGGTLHVVATLLPTIQPQGMHATGITNVVVADGRITFTEIFYGPYDIDADGTGRATTVYTWTGSSFTHQTTITQQPATSPPHYGG